MDETDIRLFGQKECARAYAAARWEFENGALSRVAALQDRAAHFSTLTRDLMERS